jgi:AcrR family transcriptional regulator
MSSSTDTAEAKPLRKDAARNRQLLIDSARQVFAERGLEASLDDVAHHAGVGVGTAYRHFANKYDLARAIFREAIDEVIALAAESAAMPDAWDGIVNFLEGIAARQTVDRGLREVLMGVHDAEQMNEVTDELERPLAQLVERAIAAGQLRPDVTSSDLGLVIVMLCTVADVAADVQPELWRRYLPMLLDSMRAGSTTELPVPPISSPELHEALSSHKQRIHRSRSGC